MSPFKKILVPLDFSNVDVAVLRFLELMQHAFLPDSITFIHIQPTLPALLEKFYDGVERDEDVSQLKKRLKEQVELHFEPQMKIEMKYVVHKGVPLSDTFNYQEKNNFDLIIVGWKTDEKSSGTFARSVALKANCSVLTVPALRNYKIEQILLPLDFSEYSIQSLKLALQINHHIGDPPLIACHVLEKIDAESKEAEKTQRKQIRLRMKERFEVLTHKMEKGAVQIDLKILKNKDGDIGYQIYNYARKSKSDMIIAGVESKRSIIKRLTGSSILHKLLYHNRNIPLLIVRELEKHPLSAKINTEASGLG